MKIVATTVAGVEPPIEVGPTDSLAIKALIAVDEQQLLLGDNDLRAGFASSSASSSSSSRGGGSDYDEGLRPAARVRVGFQTLVERSDAQTYEFPVNDNRIAVCHRDEAERQLIEACANPHHHRPPARS